MHSRKVAKNTLYGIVCKFLILLIGFITRKVFIVYIGEELLGLSSLYANLLDMLNMSELGIGIAVQYNLFKPLAEDDYAAVNAVLRAAKRVYYKIGFAVMAAGCVMAFLIQYLIKDNQFSLWMIRSSFILYVLSIGSSYFFVHKRLLLQSNEELFLVNVIDTVMNLVVAIARIWVIVAFKSYMVYIGLGVVQSLVSNLLIHFITKKRYPRISDKGDSCNVESVNLKSDLKNVIPLKLSMYIYKSTDNLIISKCIGLTAVALYSNYMLIINQILVLFNQIMDIFKVSLGLFLNEESNKKNVYRRVKQLSVIEFFCGSVCFVELVCLLSPLIHVWLGEKYQLAALIPWLLATDVYVFMAYQPLSVIFSASGKFREDRNITLGIAAVNIVVSIAMVQFMGTAGVIVGTLMCDILSFAFRTYKIIHEYFCEDVKEYILEQGGQLLVLGAETIMALMITNVLLVDISWFRVICCGILLGVVTVAGNLIYFWRNMEFKEVLIIARNILRRN